MDGNESNDLDAVLDAVQMKSMRRRAGERDGETPCAHQDPWVWRHDLEKKMDARFAELHGAVQGALVAVDVRTAASIDRLGETITRIGDEVKILVAARERERGVKAAWAIARKRTAWLVGAVAATLAYLASNWEAFSVAWRAFWRR